MAGATKGRPIGRKGLFGKPKKPVNEFRHRPGACQKCVIFDFDGTVADTYNVALSILHEIAEARRIEPPRDIESLRMMSATEVIRKYKLSVLDLLFLEKKYEDGVYRRLLKIRPFRGLKEVLRKLDTDYGLGIISSNRRENVVAFLQHTGLGKYFDFIETGSTLLGKARRIKNIVDKHGYRKADAVYVGDEVRDIDAARKVGIKIISVGWGFNKTRRLKAAKPDYFVTRPSQLPAAVERAFGKRGKSRCL